MCMVAVEAAAGVHATRGVLRAQSLAFYLTEASMQ